MKDRRWFIGTIGTILILSVGRSADALPVKGGLPGNNLLAQAGGFESLSDWAGSVRMTLAVRGAHEGAHCLELSAKSGQRAPYVYLKGRFLPVQLYPGRNYTFSIWARTDGKAVARVTLEKYDPTGKKYLGADRSSSLAGKEWQELTFKVSVPDGGCRGAVLLWIQGDGNVYYDDMKLQYAVENAIYGSRRGSVLHYDASFDEAILAPARSRDLKARITLRDPLGQTEVARVESNLAGLALKAELDIARYPWALFRTQIEILNGDTVLYRQALNFIPGIDDAHPEIAANKFPKVVNDEVGVKVAEADRLTPDRAELAGGLVLFSRPEPRWIQPDSLPLAGERITSLTATAAPGDSVFLYFAALPLQDISGLDLRLEPGSVRGKDLKGIPGIELLTCRYWPQQVNFTHRKYWIVPELIEPFQAHPVRTGRVELYAVRIPVPADAQGTYVGTLALRSKDRLLRTIDLDIKVLPVQLRDAPDIVFGLYIDEIRWLRNKAWYTDDRIVQELKTVRAYGFNSLLVSLSAPTIRRVSGGDTPRWNLDMFHRFIELTKKAGFTDRPLVVNPYALEKVAGIPKQSGTKYDPESEKVIRSLFVQLAAEFPADRSRFLIHGVDEANHGERLEESIRLLSLARRCGFKTSATTDPYVVEHTPLGPYIDYSMYGVPGFFCIRDQAEADHLRKFCADHGKTFWYYGAGCYANYNPPGPQFRHVRQEGCLTENRYLHGVWLFRSGATASWAWTFCRWVGDPENDFDCLDRGGETKEAGIVYPGPNGGGFRPTLQWEALRQGCQDYRAVRTLSDLLKPRTDAAAQRTKRELDRRIQEMPWMNYTQYPNGKLEEFREWVLMRIVEQTKGGQ